jgi:hypothetical protein
LASTVLDKQTINYAAVFGMQEEIHVSGSDFSWAVSLFYFGQLASQFVSAYFIGRFRVATVVSVAMYVLKAFPDVQRTVDVNSVPVYFGEYARCAMERLSTRRVCSPPVSSSDSVKVQLRRGL